MNLRKNPEQENEERQTKEIQKILTDWNPLGNRANQITDLNHYETEARDILFHIGSTFHFPKKESVYARITKVTKTVLNQAFDLWLTDEECKGPARKILNVVDKK